MSGDGDLPQKMEILKITPSRALRRGRSVKKTVRKTAAVPVIKECSTEHNTGFAAFGRLQRGKQPLQILLLFFKADRFCVIFWSDILPHYCKLRKSQINPVSKLPYHFKVTGQWHSCCTPADIC